ncbi:MAG TPA: hypothetical protein VGR70_09850 [Stellaceae bacterium]|nr:hypothetical protein [Stellaceae bacterium]
MSDELILRSPATGMHVSTEHHGHQLMLQALADIWTERRRQIDDKGYAPDDDDRYHRAELASAAASFVVLEIVDRTRTDGWRQVLEGISRDLWPWRLDGRNETYDDRRKLIVAGALIIAEIERLDRQAARLRDQDDPNQNTEDFVR